MKIEDLTKEELIKEHNKLKEMFADAVDKLTTTGIKLVDVSIQQRKLLIENDELKEKLNKYEKTH